MIRRRTLLVFLALFATAGCGRVYHNQFIVGEYTGAPNSIIDTEYFDISLTVATGWQQNPATLTDSVFQFKVGFYQHANGGSEPSPMLQSLNIKHLSARTELDRNVLQGLAISEDVGTHYSITPCRRWYFSQRPIISGGTDSLRVVLVYGFKASEEGPELVDTTSVTLHRARGSKLVGYSH